MIGTTHKRGLFTEDVLSTLCSLNQLPLIISLSMNKNEAECTVQEAYNFSNVSLNS